MEGGWKQHPSMEYGCGAWWRAGHSDPATAWTSHPPLPRATPQKHIFICIPVSPAALAGFQTVQRKMTKELAVYAIDIYCNSTLLHFLY